MKSYVEHDGIRLAVDDAGNGIPVLLLHGLGGDRQSALELTSLADGVRTIAIDQRGHGETEPVGRMSGYTFDTLASDAIACLDAREVSKATVVGVSMGAGVALRLAIAYADRVDSTILIRPAWINSRLTRNLAPYIEIAQLLRSKSWPDAHSEFTSSSTYATIANLSRHAAQSLASQFLKPRAVERAVRLDRMPRSVPYESDSELALIAHPTLVIGCDGDPLHPLEFATHLAGQIPNAELRIVTSTANDIDRHRDEVRDATTTRLLETRGRHSEAPANASLVHHGRANADA